MSRRSKYELCIDVLKSIKDGNYKTTRIMYGVQMSYPSLKNVLDLLIDKELVYKIPSGDDDKRTNNWYKISKRGMKVLEYYHKAEEIMQLNTNIRGY